MNDPRLHELSAARATFSTMVADVRPQLFHYCARMMGSAVDGEDVVQEALARAFYELPELRELPALRPWLFRIAHNRAINALIARSRRKGDRSIDEAQDLPASAPDADSALDQARATQLAIGRFLDLAPAQRACIILKDVLGCSLEEVGEALELTLPAVKAALHRGRTRLRELGDSDAQRSQREHTPQLVRYAELFNAHDWDGIRAMLANDVKLDVVNREKRRGARNVGHYFTNYGQLSGLRVAPAWMDGLEVLAVFEQASDEHPRYAIVLTFVGDALAAIRDFRHTRYVAESASFEF